MLDRQYLTDLLPILKLHGVKSIEMSGLKLEFHVEQLRHQQSLPLTNTDSTQVIADALKKQEAAMPPDLRADALMDQDKILNWSSPDQNPEEPEMPMTGEIAL